MTSLKDYQMRVYVENLGKYEQGDSQGAWITLPVSKSDLTAFLKNEIGVDGYGEYAIHDYAGDEGLLWYVAAPGEDASLTDLNVMCRAFESREDDDPQVYEKVQAIRDDYDATARAPLQYANLALNSDDIPYYEYEAPASVESKYGKYGWTAINHEWAPEAVVNLFADSGYGYCFDVEKFGRDLSTDSDVSLSENGYLENADWPSDIDDRYSYEELADEVSWLDDADDEHHGSACDPADPLTMTDPTAVTGVTR